jgi:hypothetical protein
VESGELKVLNEQDFGPGKLVNLNQKTGISRFFIIVFG